MMSLSKLCWECCQFFQPDNLMRPHQAGQIPDTRLVRSQNITSPAGVQPGNVPQQNGHSNGHQQNGHQPSGQADEEAQEKDSDDGMTLPFIPIKFTFSDICYYVEKPEVLLTVLAMPACHLLLSFFPECRRALSPVIHVLYAYKPVDHA